MKTDLEKQRLLEYTKFLEQKYNIALDTNAKLKEELGFLEEELLVNTESSLKKLRKELIIKALTRTKGNHKEAYKLLCPNKRPFSEISFPMVLSRLGIKIMDYKQLKK